MNIEDLRLYALSLPGVEETFPFGDDVIVFKINNKIFLLLPLNAESLRFNVKCNPDYAIELREQYNCIQPGYHMNKKHWNTVFVDGTLSARQIKKFIEDSYNLVNKNRSFNRD
ncbi:MAG: MmcQ/YjbR family DNA-binding protein [Ginsengibacter sp.]